MSNRPFSVVVIFLVASFVSFEGAVRANAADELERQLIHAAPALLKFAQEKGYKNVGVLKFRIKKGDRPGTDRAGTLNTNLALRTELALILANSVREPLGIVHDASAVAAKIPGASHLTQEGRQKLFTAKYPLAWGTESVEPDAFFTGAVAMDADLSSMTVALVAFDREGRELQKVAQFTAKPDADDLVETGETFIMRGLFDGGRVERSRESEKAKDTEIASTEAAASAVKLKSSTDPQDHPLAKTNSEAPVELELYYDQQKIPLEIRDGTAFVVEPQENQKVEFVLKRKTQDQKRYAVVLKVNGENTLSRQRSKDLNCSKWILEPGDPPITIRGFQMDDETAEEFRVLSREESKGKEMDYGTDVGTISLVVFQEKSAAPIGAPSPPSAPSPLDAPAPPSAPSAPSAPKTPTDDVAATKKPDLSASEDEDFAVLTRGIFPKERPANLAALKAQLSNQASRGLIAQGRTIGAAVRTVTYEADPVPVMSAVITYYPR